MSADGSVLITAKKPATSSTAVTLADVLQRLEADAERHPRQCREMCSALHTVCRVLGADPSSVPAQPRHLRMRLAKVTAAAAGVSTGRWSNVKSLTLKSLGRVGIKAMPGRSREPLTPQWEELRARLPDRYFRSGLSRLMSYCTAHAIAPASVTADTFVAFGTELEAHSLARDPGGLYRDTSKLWNEAATSIAGWPQLQVEVPNRRRDFSLALDKFPPAFRGDVEWYLSQRANPDVFSDGYSRPVKPLTLRNRRRNILMAATALVKSGLPVEQITGLDVLVEPKNAKAALRFLLDRAGGETTGHIHQIVILLKTIASHYVATDEKAIDEFRGMSRKLKPQTSGLTEKNKGCLRQFADLQKLAALLTLPQRLVSESDRQDGDHRRDAVKVALGLAIAIELVFPIRAHNLVGLRTDRHIHRAGKRVFLSIPAAETKNENATEAELPAWLVALMDTYLEHCRPRLVTAPAAWLFPNEKGRQRSSGGFSVQISALITKEIGIRMTLHQFRHLAAKLYLDRRPGDYETVRRLLGHKSLATTMKFYRELDAVLAVQRYGELISQLLEEAEANDLPKRRKRRPEEEHGHA